MKFQPSTTLRWLSVPALVSLLSLASTPAGAQWTTNTPLPDGYTVHSLVYSSGFLYNAGGSSTTFGETDGFHVFYSQVQSNGALSVWNLTTSLPEPVFQHSGIAANGYVYVLGGYHYTNGDFVVSDVVYYSKINTNGSLGAWQTTTHLPNPAYYFSASVWSNRIYVVGGFDDVALTNAVYSSEIQADGSLAAWITRTPLPVKIAAQAQAVNGMLYVLGGSIPNTITDKVYTSKINPDGALVGWVETTPLLQHISNFSAVAANGRVFIMGGWNGSSPVSGYYSAPVAGDGSLGAWSTETPLPKPLYGHGVAVSESHIFVSGGLNLVESQSTVYSMPLPPPPAAPALTSQAIGTNGNFQLQLASATNTGFGVLASTNLAEWERIGWGFTGTNGLLSFQDTNTASFPRRFYRAFWPLP